MRSLQLALFILCSITTRAQEVIRFGEDTITVPYQYYSLKAFPENPDLLVHVDPYGTDSFPIVPPSFPMSMELNVRKHVAGRLTEDLGTGVMYYSAGTEQDSAINASRFMGNVSKSRLMQILGEDNSIPICNARLESCRFSYFFITDTMRTEEASPFEFSALLDRVDRLQPGDCFGLMSIACPHIKRSGYDPWDLHLNGFVWMIE
jgi:hypothetical protein